VKVNKMMGRSARAVEEAVRKIQFNGVAGLQTYISFSVIDAQPSRKNPARWVPAPDPKTGHETIMPG